MLIVIIMTAKIIMIRNFIDMVVYLNEENELFLYYTTHMAPYTQKLPLQLNKFDSKVEDIIISYSGVFVLQKNKNVWHYYHDRFNKTNNNDIEIFRNTITNNKSQIFDTTYGSGAIYTANNDLYLWGQIVNPNNLFSVKRVSLYGKKVKDMFLINADILYLLLESGKVLKYENGKISMMKYKVPAIDISFNPFNLKVYVLFDESMCIINYVTGKFEYCNRGSEEETLAFGN